MSQINAKQIVRDKNAVNTHSWKYFMIFHFEEALHLRREASL